MSDTKQVYQSPEGGVEKNIDDGWKYLYESAKNNDHLTIHGATIQSLIESSRDLQAERDALKTRVEELENALAEMTEDRDLWAGNHDEYHCPFEADLAREKERNRALDEILKMWTIARPLSEYHEDMGCALWFKYPIDEPPYVGDPNCCNWPGYHTYFIQLRNEMIPVPKEALAR